MVLWCTQDRCAVASEQGDHRSGREDAGEAHPGMGPQSGTSSFFCTLEASRSLFLWQSRGELPRLRWNFDDTILHWDPQDKGQAKVQRHFKVCLPAPHPFTFLHARPTLVHAPGEEEGAQGPHRVILPCGPAARGGGRPGDADADGREGRTTSHGPYIGYRVDLAAGRLFQ